MKNVLTQVQLAKPILHEGDLDVSLTLNRDSVFLRAGGDAMRLQFYEMQWIIEAFKEAKRLLAQGATQ